MTGRISGVLASLLLAFCVNLQAQVLTEEEIKPSTTAFPLVQAPSIDGDVFNDPVWQTVAPTSGFTQQQPNEGQPSSQRTEVYIGYTDTALYIGVIAYDSDPEQIIVADSRRDSDLEETDSFQVIIDGYMDRQNGFIFGTNPAGVEYDGQVINEGSGSFGSGGGGFNLNWDAPWTVETEIGDYGWSAEMELPFSSLRYVGGGEQSWGINFQRNIRRRNEVSFWSPIERQFSLNRISEGGTISAIQVPSKRNLLVTPYVLASANRNTATIDGTDFNEEFGFDVKYSITPSLTLDTTYNTDFAQVEVDDIQINLDRFSLFFPERRPFFLENAGQFSVGNPREAELFFSRRIGVGPGGTQFPITGGARLTGKVSSDTNIGLLAMRAEGVDGAVAQNDFTVARVNHELGNRSTVGFMYVGRDGDGSQTAPGVEDTNRTYAVDGRWGIGDTILFNGWAAKTDTPGLEDDDGAYSVNANYNDVSWTLSAGYTEIQPNFNPEVGFLARTAYRKYNASIFNRYRPDDFIGILELRPHISWRRYDDFNGFTETEFTHIDNHWEWRTGDELHTGMNLTREGVKESFQIVRGVTVPVGVYEHEEAQLVFFTNQGAPASVNIRSFIGGFFGGERVNVEPTFRYRVGETFNAELSWNHSDISLPVPGGDFKVDLARLRLSYSFTPKILLQTLVQYNKRDQVLATNVRFSWLQSANAGLFVVYNEVDEDGLNLPNRMFDETARGLTVKYSRILNWFN